jgi:hypothetical protein
MSTRNKPGTAEKIFASLKGLRNHLQAGEEPLMTIPAIWDSGWEQRSMPCDVVLTNQRLIGYVFVTFPRERLFLEALSLSAITTVSLRHKSFEPLFRELLVGEGQRKVYIRAPRQKIESLYQALRTAIEQYAPAAQSVLHDNVEPQFIVGSDASVEHVSPVFGRQEIRREFQSSPLAITLLFTGGLVLEIAGALLWAITQSVQVGLPLIIAGLIAVFTAFMLRRQQR